MSESAVTLKLPQFWEAEPQIWFAQAEVQFALRKIITKDTKNFYVLAAIDQTTASQLKEFISNPLEDDKSALIARLISVCRNGPGFCSISDPLATPNYLPS